MIIRSKVGESGPRPRRTSDKTSRGQFPRSHRSILGGRASTSTELMHLDYRIGQTIARPEGRQNVLVREHAILSISSPFRT